MTDPYNVTADELRQFVERFEQLDPGENPLPLPILGLLQADASS